MQQVNDRGARAKPGGADTVLVSNGKSGELRLAGFQRARLLSAAVDAAAEKGAANITVTDILARAGMSRRTFYELFDNCGECLCAAFDNALHSATERVLPAYGAGTSWRERLRAGLTALVCFIEDEPKPARLLLVDSPTLACAWAGRERAIAPVIEAVDAGRGARTGNERLPDLAAEALVGGALSIIARVVDDPGGESPRELINPIMAMIVLPYLGAAAARRELSEPVEQASRRGRAAARWTGGDPFKELGMRLTYRTARVLTAIAEQPGASNRTVGDLAGIRDQGQISKLLRRLERLGLIEERRPGPTPGSPNAWLLSKGGRDLANDIGMHFKQVGGEA